MGDEVLIKYDGFLLDNQDIQFAKDTTEQFRLGDSATLPALELTVRSMTVGEICQIICVDRFGFHEIGCEPHVPPGASLKFRVELLTITKGVSPDQMNCPQLLEEATKKKAIGNKFFKRKDYTSASRMYGAAIKLMEHWTPDPKYNNPCRDLMVSLGNNLSNAQYKANKLKESKQAGMEVLQIDPNNVKALYRVAIVSLAQEDLTDAYEALKHAIKIDPKNRDVRDVYAKVLKRQEEVKAYEKRVFGPGGAAKAAEKEPVNFQAKESPPVSNESVKSEENEEEEDEEITPEMFKLEKRKWFLTNYDVIAISILIILLSICFKVVIRSVPQTAEVINEN